MSGNVTSNTGSTQTAVDDWQGTVTIVGGKLVADAACTDNYCDAMKQTLIDLGPYMIPAPYYNKCNNKHLAKN